MTPSKKAEDRPTAATIMFDNGDVLRLPRAPHLPDKALYNGLLYPCALPPVPEESTLWQDGVQHVVLTTPGTTRDLRRIILSRPWTLDELVWECKTYVHMAADEADLATLPSTVGALARAMHRMQFLPDTVRARLGMAPPRDMPLQQVLMAVLGNRVPVAELTDAQRAQYRDAIYWSDRSVRCAPSLSALAGQVCAYYRAAGHIPTFRQPYGRTRPRQWDGPGTAAARHGNDGRVQRQRRPRLRGGAGSQAGKAAVAVAATAAAAADIIHEQTGALALE